MTARGVHGVSEGEAGTQDLQELPAPEREAILEQALLDTGLLRRVRCVDEDLIRGYVRYQKEEERKRERHGDGYDSFS